MPYVYFGRTNTQVGKSIWEIIACLKNFGVGRIVIRNKYQRYSEPCFLRIIKAEPSMDKELMEGEVLVEEVFRGVSKGIMNYSGIGYKPDYKLIPKHEEEKFIKAYENYKLTDLRIFPQEVDMPPLLKLIAQKKGHSSTTLKMSLIGDNPRARIAKEGEVPNVIIMSSLGIPASPEFYEGVLEKYNSKILEKT